MALRKLQGLKIGRLLVLILIVAIPAFFCLLIFGFKILTWEDFSYIGTTDIPFLSPGWAKFFAWFCAPVFFSLPWVSFLLIDKDRIGETFDNMGRALRRVSIGLNLFYSVNALFVFIFFVLPWGSPAIGVFAAFGLVPWLIRKKTGARVPWWISIIPGLMLAVIPVILSIGFYANYAELWTTIWSFWTGGATTGTIIQKYGLVHVLYGFGYSVAIGAVLAGFVAFIYEGASQVDPHNRRPKGILYIFEFLIAIGVFLVYMLVDVEASYRNIIFGIISGVSIGLGLIEFILRFFKKIKRTDEENIPIGAYILLPLFIAVDFIRTGKVAAFRNHALTIALALACVVYFILFILAYSYAGESYPSRWSKKREDDEDNEEDNGEEKSEAVEEI